MNDASNNIWIGDDDWPQWLMDIAVEIDELVQNPEVLARFQRMLGQWHLGRAAKGPKRDSDAKRRRVYNGVEVFPRRARSIAHKYAVLAAIHDTVCAKTKRIDPWRSHKAQASVARARLGTPFAVLCSLVKDLRNADRQLIERWRDDVVRDVDSVQIQSGSVEPNLSDPAPSGTSSAATPPHEGGPGPSRDQAKPDDSGYVAKPLEPGQYIPASVILTDFTPENLFISLKKLAQIVEDYAQNRVRWTRPLKRDGEPNPRRRAVHIPDWAAYCANRKKLDSEGFPVQAAEESEARKVTIRAMRPH